MEIERKNLCRRDPPRGGKEDTRRSPDRRVRLARAVGDRRKNKITVTDDEVSRAVIERARPDARPREGSLGLLSQQCNALAQLVRRFMKTRCRFHPRTRQCDRKEVSRGDLLRTTTPRKTAA